MNEDDDSQYLASNFLKKKPVEDDSQYLASNFRKNPKEKNPSLLERAARDVQEHINEPIESLGRAARDTLGGFAQGIANIPSGIWNLGASGANALGGNVPKASRFDVVPHSPSKELGEFASFFAPGSLFKLAGKIPEVSHTAKAVSKIPLIAQGIKHASDILKKAPMASAITGNALLGGAYAPENPLLGASLGAAAPVIGKGVEKTYNALRPSRVFRGNLSPEELKANLDIARGTETGLGDVIGNPMLKRFNENILSKIPFSGVNESLQRNAGTVIKRGEDIMSELLGKANPENLDKNIHNALNSSYKTHQKVKNSLYDEVNSIGDELGVNLHLPEFSKKVKAHKNAIEDTNIIKYEPELQKLLGKLGGYSNPTRTEKTVGKIVDEFGNPIVNKSKTTGMTLKEANLLKGKLNAISQKHKSSPLPEDRHLAGVFGDLGKTLKSDIQSAIEKTEHEPLRSGYKLAEHNYAKNYSPFLDNEVYKFIGGKADPETLVSSFIKTGKANDRAGLITKLVDKLPKEDRNLLGHRYLQRALDENNVLNPLKLKTLLSRNALGSKQFEALFPDPEIRNALKDYVKLIDMNTKGLKLMQNPDTGQMSMDILPLISKSGASFGGKLLGAPVVAKKLRSEKVRNALVNEMIRSSK